MSDRTSQPIPPLSEASDVSKLFSSRAGLWGTADRGRFVRAIDRVSLAINHGESIGLVGESGCGKSTLGKLLIRLETPTAGTIFFNGEDITRLKGGALRKKRREMQMIFQDPASSLNPRFTVHTTLDEALKAHRSGMSTRARNAHMAALLEMVGLPLKTLDRVPKELSGGERQRVAIARALAVEPRFLVADEPVTSLDLTSQAQITALLASLKRELNVSFLLITHNTSLVRILCERVAVMYLGRIVESAPTKDLFSKPAHPYTRALLASVLSQDPETRKLSVILPGDPPSPLNPPKGCHFHPRCPHAEIQCKLLVPVPRRIGSNSYVRCHYDFEGEVKSIPISTTTGPEHNSDEVQETRKNTQKTDGLYE